MFRRRVLPPELAPARAALDTVLDELEPAKAALADALPGARLPGRPLLEALAEFEEGAARADAAMAEWRCPPVEQQWQACAAGLARARADARAFREQAPDLDGFEALLGLVQHLLDLLEPFASASARFDELRISARR